MFINLSNHTVNNWSKEQLAAGEIYGEIIDLPFPMINPLASRDELVQLANQYVERIQEYKDVNVIMVQGEMCFTFIMVERLKELGYKVVCACSKRDTVETINAEGNSVKTSVFKFVQFREY